MQVKKSACLRPRIPPETLKDIRAGMKESGQEQIEIDERPDDAAGFRKLAAGRLDGVFSNRDRGCGHHQKRKADGQGALCRAAQGDLLLRRHHTKAYPHPEVAEQVLLNLENTRRKRQDTKTHKKPWPGTGRDGRWRRPALGSGQPSHTRLPLTPHSAECSGSDAGHCRDRICPSAPAAGQNCHPWPLEPVRHPHHCPM